MIRVLFYLALVIAFYFGFTYLSENDGKAQLAMFGYIIHTSSFLVIAVISFIVTLLITAMLFIKSLIRLPFDLSHRFYNSRQNKDVISLLDGFQRSLTGQYSVALKLAKPHLRSKQNLSKKAATFIMYQASTKHEDRIYYLKELLTFRDINYFAYKELVFEFLRYDDFAEALFYANEALKINDTDEKLNLAMIDIYGNLNMPEQLSDVIDKIDKLHNKHMSQIAAKAANYLHKAAQNLIDKNQDDGAMEYLHKALEIKPSHYLSLNLLAEIYNSTGQITVINEIICRNFAVNPAIELFDIYYSFNQNQPKDEIYMLFKNKVDYCEDYRNIFSYIALQLKLENEFKALENL